MLNDMNRVMQNIKDSGIFKAEQSGRILTRRPIGGRQDPLGLWKKLPWREVTTKCGLYAGFRYKNKSIYSHVLVYFWFKGPIPVGMEVDHKDQDSANRRLSNLELVTPSENVQRVRANPKQGPRLRKLLSTMFKGRKYSQATIFNMKQGSRRRWNNTPQSVKSAIGKAMCARRNQVLSPERRAEISAIARAAKAAKVLNKRNRLI